MTLTLTQYERLKPYRGAIMIARSATGEAAGHIWQMYHEWTGRTPNPGCRACVETMLNYFTNLITEYEQANNILG
jgi:hypothetical protein